MRKSTPTGRGLALVALLVLAAAGLLLAAGDDPPRPAVMVMEGASAFHFDTLPEMVATSTTVVRGTVVATGRGQVIDEGEVAYTRKLLTIRVHDHLAGKAVNGQVTVETAGWRQADGEAETELRLVDELPVGTGASGLFFLYDFEGDGHYGFVTGQGVLLVDGTAVRDTSRDDPLVRDLERRTVADLQVRIAQAKLAVEQGRVRARVHPGSAG